MDIDSKFRYDTHGKEVVVDLSKDERSLFLQESKEVHVIWPYELDIFALV